jgi:hypothetical protein
MRAAWLAAPVLVAAVHAHAQPALHAGAGMATRSVAKYLQLERDLQQSLAARDDAAAKQMLADDFQLRTPAAPEPLGADQWLRHHPADARDRVRELNVQEPGDLAIVSFLLDAPTGRRRVRFVVDVWRDDKLLSRYEAWTSEAPPRAARPSGRE